MAISNGGNMKYIITMIISAIVMFFIDYNKSSLPEHSLGVFYLLFIVVIGYCVFKLMNRKNSRK